MKNIMLKSFVFAVIFLVSIVAYSQPTPPAPSAVPLDGGLSLLLALGAGYGGFRFMKSRKNKNE